MYEESVFTGPNAFVPCGEGQNLLRMVPSGKGATRSPSFCMS